MDSEVSLKLDSYEDIFSDFDIRPYSKRALSVDFLEEIKRASRDKAPGGVDLMLHVPESTRSESEESVIKERLGEHFKKHYHRYQGEKKKVLRLGISMVTLGVIFMILATYIVFREHANNPLFTFLVVFLEPMALWLLWEGMDQIIFNSKNIHPELNFYKKMSDSCDRIFFKSYAS